jgi:hypothetical protein
MNILIFRALKFVVEFHAQAGRYPFIGGSLRGPMAYSLESEGYLVLDERKRQIVRITARGLSELEDAPQNCAEVAASRPTLSEVIEQLHKLPALHIRDIRRLAETLNVPDRLKLRRRELIDALKEASRLLDSGWRLNTARTFLQWRSGDGGSAWTTLDQAVRQTQFQNQAAANITRYTEADLKRPRNTSLAGDR